MVIVLLTDGRKMKTITFIAPSICVTAKCASTTGFCIALCIISAVDTVEIFYKSNCMSDI